MNFKNQDEAIDAYMERFGWWPAFVIGCQSDEFIIPLVEKALAEDKELEFDFSNPDIQY